MLNNVEREKLDAFVLWDRHFSAIRIHYGERKAERSGKMLLNHIVEGLKILIRLDASTTTMQAWCLHPIVQSNEDLGVALVKGLPVPLANLSVVPLLLAMEYRAVANSYLSSHTEVDVFAVRENVNAFSQIRQMLIADKIQNSKDFSAQPVGTYDNEDRLHIYFDEWLFDILNLGLATVGELDDLINQHKE